MAIEDFYTTPVTIVTPSTGSDRYNQSDVLDYDNPADQTAASGWLVQIAADETLGDRDATVTRWRIFLPADAPISAISRVVVDPPEYEMDSTTFEVVGVPDVVSTPSGPHHVECVLRLVAG